MAVANRSRRGYRNSGVGRRVRLWGNAIASAIYLVLLLLELFWWPKWQQQLLANADRAAEMAREKSE